MAAGKAAVAFDEIIQADRQRRKHTALAEEIFGKARKTNVQKGRGGRVNGAPSSLAGRFGVSKFSAAAPNRRQSNPFHTLSASHNSPAGSRPSTTQNRSFSASRLDRVASNLNRANGDELVGFRNNAAPLGGNGINIRGTATGLPHIVIARNFAPGTTVADIESAMAPVGGEITSCRIVREAPHVVAEIAFAERTGAEKVVESFDQQKADGRILELHLQTSRKVTTSTRRIAPETLRGSILDRSGSVDIDSRGTQSPLPRGSSALAPEKFNTARETADLNRREARGAHAEVQDGSYGFIEVDQTQTPRAQTQKSTTSGQQSLDARPPRDERERGGGGVFRSNRDEQQSQPSAQQDPSSYNNNHHHRGDRRYDSRERDGQSSSPYTSYHNRGTHRGNVGYARRAGDHNRSSYDSYRSSRRQAEEDPRDTEMDIDMDAGNDNNTNASNHTNGTGNSGQPQDRGRLYSDEIVHSSRGRGGGEGSYRGRRGYNR